MTGKRIALAGLAVAVVAVVIVLILDVTSSNADEQHEPRVAEASGKTIIVDKPIAKTRLGSPPAVDTDEAPRDTDDSARKSGDGTIEYIKDDGTHVRDHRAADKGELKPRPVARKTLLKIRNDIRPLIKDCGKQLRQRDRSIRGKMQADLTVSISTDRIVVESLDLQVQGLDDSEYTTCVRTALEGLELFAPDGQDPVDKHTMSFPFAVP